jgi:hypothetical protein
MDITTTPDVYTPSVDDNGNYIDRIPLIHNGIYCSCGVRKDKVYDNHAKFQSHIKSKIHQKWIVSLNNNKANYYVEALQLKELVEQQKKILTQLENTLQTKILTIDYLTGQLIQKQNQNKPCVDLLDIN